jgi:hypothetical protein
MPKSPTARLGVPRYEDSETASFSAQVNAIAEAIDAKAMAFVADTFAKRPAAGVNGRYFLATDGKLSGTTEGDLYFDNGTAWSGPRNVITTGPIGSLMDSAATGDPVDPDGVTRWLVCDGRAISRATYAGLFAKISTTYGEGNGSTTFNIPNLAGRVAVMPGGSGVTLGSVGGKQQLDEAVYGTLSGTKAVAVAGTNMQPYLGLHKIIRVL